MSLKASYEFLFVGKDDNSFLENYYYDLFQDYGDKSGQIFVNLEVQNNPVDAEEIGSVIFETLQKVFFEEVGRDPYERFESALKSVNAILGEFKSQKVSGYIGNLNIIIAAIVGEDLYLSQTGDAEAYLIRKRYVSIISEGLSEDEDNDDVFSSIASGKIEAGDFVLFSSSRLLRYISKTDLARTVNKKSIEETLNEVRDIISTEMLGRVGLTGILFARALKSDVEDIENEIDTATRSVLESSGSHSSAQKETLTGKFFTALKDYKRRRSNVYQGGGSGVFSSVREGFGRMFKGLFAKGFGKDKILALLFLVIIGLSVGIWFAEHRRDVNDQLAELDTILTGVQTKLAEAETKAEYDKETAKIILDQAYQDAMTVLNSDYRDKATIYLVQIDELRDGLDNVQRVESPKVLVNLAEKNSNINALGFATVGDRVFVYDSNGLYEIVLDQVQDPLTIDDEETVIAATGFDDRGSVVFLTKSGKLLEYRGGTVSFMDTDDGSFHKAVDLDDWSNKIYLLDATGSQIWKYTFKGTSEKFGPAEPYIAEEVDLSNALSFAIDANIYMLNSTGDIWKFYAGGKQEFYINNPPFNSFSDPKTIYTNEKLDQVFVLDSKEARVLTYQKDSKTGNLNYVSQYLLDGVGELRDIYVDADSKKLFILTQSQILEVDL